MKQVLGKIFHQNGHQLSQCSPTKPISCDNASVEGLEWFVPDMEAAIFRGYKRVIQTAKPTPDSVRVIRVFSEGQTYWVVVNDNATGNEFTTACNACCEAGTPTIASPAIPALLQEDEVCADSNGDYVHYAQIPTLIAGQKITLSGTIAGAEIVYDTPIDTAGYASAAALLAFLLTDAEAYGTWSLVGTAPNQYLKLVTTSVNSKAGIQVPLVAAPFCTGAITLPVTFDTVVHNGITSTILPVTAQTTAEVVQAVASIFADGNLTLTIAGKIGYTGTGIPGTIKLGATTKATFGAGVCA